MITNRIREFSVLIIVAFGIASLLSVGTCQAQVFTEAEVPPPDLLPPAVDLSTLRRGAELGIKEAQYGLGSYLMSNEGVPLDDDLEDSEALIWLKKAANQGVIGAQVNLGVFYEGIDDSKAMSWFLKSALEEHPFSQYKIGAFFDFGIGVPESNSVAVKWYQKAAEHGYTRAEVALGVHLADGSDGVPKNAPLACAWFRRAAESGDADGQFYLGTMYALGNGVIQSGASAIDWFYRAGLSYLEQEGDREAALRCAEKIQIVKELQPNAPNLFLGDQLLRAIYSRDSPSSGAQHQDAPGGRTGTAWMASTNLAVTANHVVDGVAAVSVLFPDGELVPAQVIQRDPINDLALLKIGKTGRARPPIPIARERTSPGEDVFSVGYPHPDLMGTAPKVTNGIVSALSGFGDDPRVLQISVPLQAGNSGGPLLNMRGEVVGVVVSKLNAAAVFDWTGDLPQNVNYAIKAPYIEPLLSSVGASGSARRAQASGGLEFLVRSVSPSIGVVIAE